MVSLFMHRGANKLCSNSRHAPTSDGHIVQNIIDMYDVGSPLFSPILLEGRKVGKENFPDRFEVTVTR